MYILFLAMLLFSTLRTEGGAIFYLGDAAILTFVSGGVLIASTRGLLMRLQPTIWYLVAFPILTLFLDLGNGVPLGDIGRGIGRNAIFSLSVVAGLLVIRSKGWNAWAWVIVFSFVGMPLGAFIYDPDSLTTFETFLKFGGGSGLTIAFSIMLARRRMRLAAFALFFGAFMFYVGSFRGMAAMCLCVSVGLFFFPLSTANDRFQGFVLGFFLVVAVVLTEVALPDFKLSGLLDTRFLMMQESSSIERSDLATVGWTQFLEHPLTGIGTWQFARSYVSIFGRQELLGIHSIFIQFACEYGILGIILVSLVILINIWALYCLSLGGFAVSNFARSGLVWASTMIGYNTIFSPFSGDARFQYGLLFSGVLAILLESRNTWRISRSIATTSDLN